MTGQEYWHNLSWSPLAEMREGMILASISCVQGAVLSGGAARLNVRWDILAGLSRTLAVKAAGFSLSDGGSRKNERFTEKIHE